MPVPQQSHNNNKPRRFKRMASTSTKVSVRIPAEIDKNIKTVKALFETRWPRSHYPGLSSILQMCIERSVSGWIEDPNALDADVKDFTKRYAQKKG